MPVDNRASRLRASEVAGNSARVDWGCCARFVEVLKKIGLAK